MRRPLLAASSRHSVSQRTKSGLGQTGSGRFRPKRTGAAMSPKAGPLAPQAGGTGTPPVLDKGFEHLAQMGEGGASPNTLSDEGPSLENSLPLPSRPCTAETYSALPKVFQPPPPNPPFSHLARPTPAPGA